MTLNEIKYLIKLLKIINLLILLNINNKIKSNEIKYINKAL